MSRLLALLLCLLAFPALAQHATVTIPSTVVTGPASATSGNCASFNGTTGKIVQDSGSVCGAGSAALTLLATLDATGGVATLQDTTHITATYNAYQIVFSQITPASNAVNFQIQVSINAGGAWISTNYHGGSTTFISLTDTTGGTPSITNTANLGGISGSAIFTNPNGTGGGAGLAGTVLTGVTGGSVAFIQGTNTTTSVINGIRFLFSAGNIASGFIKIYGMS